MREAQGPPLQAESRPFPVGATLVVARKKDGLHPQGVHHTSDNGHLSERPNL